MCSVSISFGFLFLLTVHLTVLQKLSNYIKSSQNCVLRLAGWLLLPQGIWVAVKQWPADRRREDSARFLLPFHKEISTRGTPAPVFSLDGN